MVDRRILPGFAIPEVALLLATTPLVLSHFQNLWQMRPHYQFFPVLVSGVAWLMWSRWPPWKPAGLVYIVLRAVLFVAGLVGLIAGVLLFSPTLGTAAAILLFGALLVDLAGRNVGTLVTSWLLLWMIVPPPFRLDLRLIQSLQGIVSRTSSIVFDAFGIEHVMSGNVLDLPGKRLLVEQACSGINSLLTLLCASALFVIAARRPLFRSSLLILCAVGWALLVNLTRVVVIGVMHTAWQVDWSTGWVHDALGFILVAIAFLLLVSTDYLLGWLLGEVGVIHEMASGRDTRVQLPGTGGLAVEVNPFSYFWDRWVGGVPSEQLETDVQAPAQSVGTGPVRPAAAGLVWSASAISLAAVLFGAQLFLVFQPRGPMIAGELQHLPFAQIDLTGTKWQVTGYRTEQRDRNSDEGALSNIWSVSGPKCEAIVSVDYPFQGWHELPNCYVGLGWDVVSRRMEQHSAEQGGDLVEVVLSNSTGEHAYLLFSLFAADGQPLTARASHWRSLSVRLTTNPIVALVLGETSAALPGANSFQVQLFVPSFRPLSIDERAECHEQFLAYRATLLRSATQLVKDNH